MHERKEKNEFVKLHFLASYQSSTVHNLASPRFERKTQIGRFPLQHTGANSEEQFVYPSWFDWPLLAFSTNLIDSTRWGRLKELGFSGNIVKWFCKGNLKHKCPFSRPFGHVKGLLSFSWTTLSDLYNVSVSGLLRSVRRPQGVKCFLKAITNSLKISISKVYFSKFIFAS